MGRGSSGSSRSGGSRSSSSSRGGSFRSSSSHGRGSSSSSYRPSFSSSSFSRPSPYYRNTRYSGGFYRSSGTPLLFVNTGYTAFAIVTIMILFCVVLPVILVTFRFNFMSSGGSITPSTIDREPLEKKYVTLTNDWIYDDMGWIRSQSKVEKGLREFYDKTGVAPYLVVVSQVNDTYHPTGEQVYDFANEVYDQMFTDEGHMVFVLQCQDGSVDYAMAAVTGAMAKTVIDDEALEILYDYMDYNFNSDKTEDEMFADTFTSAADRIMTKTPNYLVMVILGVLLVIAIIAVACIIKMRIKRKREEAEERQRILETPVSQIHGTGAAEDLADKYEDS